MWMTERAMEELERLEARHPARFDYLKLELQSLISDYELNPSKPNPTAASSSVSTQASSNRRMREAVFGDGDSVGFGLGKRRKMDKRSSDSRAEMAIERAKACLRRIQVVKESFFP